MKIRLLDDRLIIEPEKPVARTRGGIYLPERHSAPDLQPKVGRVTHAGDGRIAEAFPNWTRSDPTANLKYEPQRLPLRVAVGDAVVYNGYSETAFERDGKRYVLITERDVIGVLDEAVDASASPPVA